MVLPQRKTSMVFIVLSFLAAFYLTIMPIPIWAEAYRPPWVALLLIYWCLALPDKIGVAVGWLIGIGMDVLTGTMLGENALTLAVIAWISLYMHNRLRVFPGWQQAVVVLAMLLLQTLLSFWIRSSFDHMPASYLFWAPPFIGAFVWPWLYIILNAFQSRFGSG